LIVISRRRIGVFRGPVLHLVTAHFIFLKNALLSVNLISKKTFLPRSGGLQIQVSDSLDLITPYTALKQGEWFDHEIKFLRKTLRSAEKIIDVGANTEVCFRLDFCPVVLCERRAAQIPSVTVAAAAKPDVGIVHEIWAICIKW
jgi:hypothetical protein